MPCSLRPASADCLPSPRLSPASSVNRLRSSNGKERMTFSRNPSANWHQDVPGARWFKADLHVHTIDDYPGKKAKPPAGMQLPNTQAGIQEYAKRFLQVAVENGVQVLALTPHSPRFPSLHDQSAVWAIVNAWNDGDDDDGVPFRQKVYAVFPGFEPSVKQGSAGLHLLFLFDPEIGQAKYNQACDGIMSRAEVWNGSTLNIAMRDAEGAFAFMKDFHEAEIPRYSGKSVPWRYLVLAPHVSSDKGLLSAQKAQVLEHFSHDQIAALELGDNQLPAAVFERKPWLESAMTQHRQAFFHGSDAYTVNNIGHRHTWIKLASPRIEALRQAFISSDSRIRLGFERELSNSLRAVPTSPDVTSSGRAWLKSVTVEGGASFFGRTVDGQTTATRFDLSPDLTCIIGGSMTGKSTFIDGLRSYVKAAMPNNEGIKKQVVRRGEMVFRGGFATVSLDLIGTDPSEPLPDRWPALFFAQNELQRLAEDPEAVEDILSRLAPTETQGIKKRDLKLRETDRELSDLATGELVEAYAKIEELDQHCATCSAAAADLAQFKAAGVERLKEVSEDLERWRIWQGTVESLRAPIDRAVEVAAGMEIPPLEPARYHSEADGIREASGELIAGLESIDIQLNGIGATINALNRGAEATVGIVSVTRDRMQEQIEMRLADQGSNTATIHEFDALSRRAAQLPAYQHQLDQWKEKLEDREKRLKQLLGDRRKCIGAQRRGYDRVANMIHDRFGGRFVVTRVDHGDTGPLDAFLSDLKETGVTRWWNATSKPGPSPEALLEHLRSGTLGSVGMSETVGSTFRERMTRRMRRALAAIRCPDRYELAMELEDGPRRLDQLSGGQRVSVILSLLLESSDERALVIDQPEDELDNRFLSNTVLPALKRLKGRRQIIVATHNANIVVNGDADQVIMLEATANRGRIAQAGAIEDAGVRDAIVQTVDGGDEAFRLRHRKYGF